VRVWGEAGNSRLEIRGVRTLASVQPSEYTPKETHYNRELLVRLAEARYDDFLARSGQ
jgi:hypothetical protein